MWLSKVPETYPFLSRESEPAINFILEKKKNEKIIKKK